jgi:hypothetical protein
MISLYLFLFGFSSTAVSTPISSYTFSNPAFTGLFGDYELYVEQRDIGEITFFNFSSNIQNWAFGFSNAYHETEQVIDKRSWMSLSRHFDVPFSIGVNGGVHQRWSETNLYFDIGAAIHYLIDLGITYNNMFDEEELPRILRAGASLRWRQFTGTIEIEDSIRQEQLIPHLIVAMDVPIEEFCIRLYAGYRHAQGADLENLVFGAAEISYRNMIRGAFIYDDYAKLTMGFNIKPRVQVHRVQYVDTLIVEKPVIIEKPVYREPKTEEKEPPALTAKDKKYCEEHYLQGINHFVKDQLPEAIAEWERVVKVCPKYKEVQRYLENARAKLELLEE